ncbi:hypothetical protein FWG76_02465 [Candidatus Saccharibacteria bacterium]|nr:hypothetical protein [Candidatus Saccharibacteria bacterium]
MNEQSAITNGNLEGNSMFFGTSTSEVVARSRLTLPATDFSGWNNDDGRTVISGTPWFYTGGMSMQEANAGIFSTSRRNAAADYSVSHRTILLGY